MPKAPAPKTRPTEVPVGEYLTTVEPPARRLEAERIIALVTATTGVEPVMWGASIVGWGESAMRYANGATLDWPVIGFTPRPTQHTFYLLRGFEAVRDELARLGSHRIGKGCLYIRRLEAIDESVLSEVVARAWRLG